AFVLSQDQTLQKKWFNQPRKEGQVQSLTEKQLTRKSNCPSIKGNPSPHQKAEEHGVQINWH
ncbi:hypothetical protein, partial [Agromyces tropicus]|uniref:hypothetical protein n=1 Tax=Agromyces tropicus TaxID=555371 RepID=UPI0031D371AE